MASTRAIQAAEAVNSLLHLSPGDQNSLLEVIADYFTTPYNALDDESGSESSDTEVDEIAAGVQCIIIIHSTRIL